MSIFSEPTYNRAVTKFVAHFVTTDKVTHSYHGFNYIAREVIRCSCRDYLMRDIIENGYCVDDNNIYYPLSNVISIQFEAIDTKIVKLGEYQVFYKGE